MNEAHVHDGRQRNFRERFGLKAANLAGESEGFGRAEDVRRTDTVARHTRGESDRARRYRSAEMGKYRLQSSDAALGNLKLRLQWRSKTGFHWVLDSRC